MVVLGQMRILLSGGFNQLHDCLKVHPELSKYVGMFKTPLSGYSFPRLLKIGLPLALDNGCYSGFDERKFRKMLDGAKSFQGHLMWIASPDVVGDARATNNLFQEWREALTGFRVAYVGQDGAEDLDVPFNSFDCLFVGGSTDWKLSKSARDLIDTAKQLEKTVHVGRVNSEKRLRYCYRLGVDTVDGSGYFRYKWWYLAQMLFFMDGLHRQGVFQFEH